MTTNTNSQTVPEQITLSLCDLPLDVNQEDIESFLSAYKSDIKLISIDFVQKNTNQKKTATAKVTFTSGAVANSVKKEMNLKKIRNHSVRIIFISDISLKNNSKNNLFVKNIPKSVSPREVYEQFSKYGEISSAKLNEDESGNHYGYAYITYYDQESARKAIEESKSVKLWNEEIQVEYYQTKQERKNNLIEPHVININNLPEKIKTTELTTLCEAYGKVIKCNIFIGEKELYYAVVQYSTDEEAKKAISELNDKEIKGKKIKVFLAQPKFEQKPTEPIVNFNRIGDSTNNKNLYVKNIPLNATEKDLEKAFGKYGKVMSVKIEKDILETKDNKKIANSRGYGYVLFDKVEDAKKATTELNGKYLAGFESWTRPLFVEEYVPRAKREMMGGSVDSYINTTNIPSGNQMALYPFMNSQYKFPMYQIGPMFPMGIPTQYKPMRFMYPNNVGFNKPYGRNNYNNRGRRGRGKGHRGMYYKNQRGGNNNPQPNTQATADTPEVEQPKEIIKFDYKEFNELQSEEDKKDFLGERLYKAIQESPNFVGKNPDENVIGKITGMIVEIPDNNEIIEILEKPELLNMRIKEALSLIQESQQGQ